MEHCVYIFRGAAEQWKKMYDRTSRGMSHHNLKVFQIEVWKIENSQWAHRTNKLNFLDLKASETH